VCGVRDGAHLSALCCPQGLMGDTSLRDPHFMGGRPRMADASHEDGLSEAEQNELVSSPLMPDDLRLGAEGARGLSSRSPPSWSGRRCSAIIPRWCGSC
jgi:hypothetical protein